MMNCSKIAHINRQGGGGTMTNMVRVALVCALVAFATIPKPTLAQGSIFGMVQNSDLSSPANGQLTFFGFLGDTDNELRIEAVIGAGYDNSNWFDDFQNYLDESPGKPYRYYFYNTVNGEVSLLAGTVPNNSFQQENVQLMPMNWPAQPTGLRAITGATGEVTVSWDDNGPLTYHVYRRESTSGGSFFRVDNTAGLLTDIGVSGQQFIDTGSELGLQYEYLIIGQDGSGNFSQRSDVVLTGSASVCCLLPGDATHDGKVNIGDVTFLIARIFNFGVAPVCQDEADATGDNKVNIGDVTFLISRIFHFGPAPVCGTTGS